MRLWSIHVPCQEFALFHLDPNIFLYVCIPVEVPLILEKGYSMEALGHGDSQICQLLVLGGLTN